MQVNPSINITNYKMSYSHIRFLAFNHSHIVQYLHCRATPVQNPPFAYNLMTVKMFMFKM